MRLEKELRDIYFPLIERLDSVKDFSIKMNKKTYEDDSFEDWSIIIKRQDLLCNIYMSFKNYILNLRKGTLQFSHFCIENQQDAINVCAEWIENQKNITNIEWVTKWESIYESLILLQPELNLADTKISQGGITTLEMCYQLRSCRIYFGIKDKPKWQFSWDNHIMFELAIEENSILANFLHHWLILGTLPSKLQQVFPNLNIKKMALFWEQKEYEKALKVGSWNSVEKFHESLEANLYFPKLLPLLRALRSHNYDEILFAGKQSHSATLILSPIADIHSDGIKRLFFVSDRDKGFNLEIYDSWENWSKFENALAVFETPEYNDTIRFLVEEFINFHS